MEIQLMIQEQSQFEVTFPSLKTQSEPKHKLFLLNSTTPYHTKKGKKIYIYSDHQQSFVQPQNCINLYFGAFKE